MPRSLTTAFGNAVAAAVVRPAVMFEGLFDSGPLRLWTGYGTITYLSNSYIGAGTLISIEAIDDAAGVEANGALITLSGIPSTLVSMSLSEPYQGRAVRLYMALFDASLALIANPDLLFTGFADTMDIVDSGDTCTIRMAAESRLVALQRPRPRRYEDQDQKIDYPMDRGFEYVTTIQDKTIKWGT